MLVGIKADIIVTKGTVHLYKDESMVLMTMQDIIINCLLLD